MMDLKGMQIAWSLSKGTREVQEDALHLWFDDDNQNGYVIIADGMGGHTCGDIASSLVVSAINEYLEKNWLHLTREPSNIRPYLQNLLNVANDRLAHYIKNNPQTKGMGSTLLVAIILDQKLFWVSVGDSILYLFRDRKISQLNEDHSMAQQIDQMVIAGQLTATEAENHPNRFALTSVVMGNDIPSVDFHAQAFDLIKGDMLLISTDGLRSLSTTKISQTLTSANQSADGIVASIASAIDASDNPHQDNLAFCVARVL